MARHRFKIGQLVDFAPRKGAGPASSSAYKVMQLLPAERGGPQYRIKSDAEVFDRVAEEQSLTPRVPR